MLPRLLFVSPAFPDVQGNGLAMRAGVFLEGLAQHYRVTLLVVPLFVRPADASDALIERWSAEKLVVTRMHETSIFERLRGRADQRPSVMRAFGRYVRACIDAVGPREFDVIHALRLYTAPLALGVANSLPAGLRPRLHLDLDDIESVVSRRMADLYRWNLDRPTAASKLQEADRYEEAERLLLPAFDRVYAGSQADAEHLKPVVRGELVVAPNAVRLPVEPVEPLTSHPFTFLFVGSLGYYPNEDAVRFFCRRVLPLIRSEAPAPFLVRIAGTGMPPELAELERIEGVRMVGEVEDVRTEYADADAVIVPIRGGGGTRIKVLEAFAHHRPVVSTSQGIEGIEAAPEEHYLLGDTPEAFAVQCLRLMRERGLRASLSDRAFELVASHYTPERVGEIIAP